MVASASDIRLKIITVTLGWWEICYCWRRSILEKLCCSVWGSVKVCHVDRWFW